MEAEENTDLNVQAPTKEVQNVVWLFLRINPNFLSKIDIADNQFYFK